MTPFEPDRGRPLVVALSNLRLDVATAPLVSYIGLESYPGSRLVRLGIGAGGMLRSSPLAMPTLCALLLE